MHEAVTAMMDRYRCRTTDDYTNALREIMQEVALLGLWRARFFEHAAFYGGTALRVLHQLDRYSEDMDFSLLRPDAGFQLGAYGGAIERELQAYGFDVSMKTRPARADKPIHSAFLKANTYESILTITTAEDIAEAHPQGQDPEDQAGSGHAAAGPFRYRIQIPAAAHPVRGADLYAAKPVCREDARRAVSPMGHSRQGA